MIRSQELPHVDFPSTKWWRVFSEDLKCLFTKKMQRKERRMVYISRQINRAVFQLSVVSSLAFALVLL